MIVWTGSLIRRRVDQRKGVLLDILPISGMFPSGRFAA